MKEMAAKKASAKKAEPNKAVAVGNIDYSNDFGAGMEGATADSYAIPFLKVLQKGSPEVDEDSGAQVKGAKAGMFFNTVTQELFDGKVGVPFIQSAYQRRFVKWAPRKAAQGFLGELAPEAVDKMVSNGEIVDYKGRLYFPAEDGTIDRDECVRVQDTRNHFGVTLGKDGVPSQVLLSLSSTQIKKSKLLMSMLGQQRIETKTGLKLLPSFATEMRLTTVPESNDEGSWFGVHVAKEGRVEDAHIYNAAKAFHDSVHTGAVNVNYDAAAEAASGGAAAEDEKF
jgi:hypothetical protein